MFTYVFFVDLKIVVFGLCVGVCVVVMYVYFVW